MMKIYFEHKMARFLFRIFVVSILEQYFTKSTFFGEIQTNNWSENTIQDDDDPVWI